MSLTTTTNEHGEEERRVGGEFMLGGAFQVGSFAGVYGQVFVRISALIPHAVGTTMDRMFGFVMNRVVYQMFQKTPLRRVTDSVGQWAGRTTQCKR
jgi:hypothetical protein